MLMLESASDLEIVLFYCTLDMKKTCWNASKQWIFMAPFSSRAIRSGDSWKQKSLMGQRRHQSCKDETVCSAQSQGTWQCTINQTISECMLLNGQRSLQHQKGPPSIEIMNPKLNSLELGKNLPTSSACRSLPKWYRKNLQGNFSEGNSIKMYNSTQKKIIRERNG